MIYDITWRVGCVGCGQWAIKTVLVLHCILLVLAFSFVSVVVLVVVVSSWFVELSGSFVHLDCIKLFEVPQCGGRGCHLVPLESTCQNKKMPHLRFLFNKILNDVIETFLVSSL